MTVHLQFSRRNIYFLHLTYPIMSVQISVTYTNHQYYVIYLHINLIDMCMCHTWIHDTDKSDGQHEIKFTLILTLYIFFYHLATFFFPCTYHYQQLIDSVTFTFFFCSSNYKPTTQFFKFYLFFFFQIIFMLKLISVVFFFARNLL